MSSVANYSTAARLHRQAVNYLRWKFKIFNKYVTESKKFFAITNCVKTRPPPLYSFRKCVVSILRWNEQERIFTVKAHAHLTALLRTVFCFLIAVPPSRLSCSLWLLLRIKIMKAVNRSVIDIFTRWLYRKNISAVSEQTRRMHLSRIMNVLRHVDKSTQRVLIALLCDISEHTRYYNSAVLKQFERPSSLTILTPCRTTYVYMHFQIGSINDQSCGVFTFNGKQWSPQRMSNAGQWLLFKVYCCLKKLRVAGMDERRPMMKGSMFFFDACCM